MCLGLAERSVAKRGDTKEEAYYAPLSSPAASPGKGDVVVLLAEGERKAVIFSGLLTLLGDGCTGSLEAERFLSDGWLWSLEEEPFLGTLPLLGGLPTLPVESLIFC